MESKPALRGLSRSSGCEFSLRGVLEASGLVRIDGATGGGGQRVAVTERGRRVLTAALPAWREAQARAVAALGDVGIGRLDTMIAALGGEGPPRRERRGRTEG